MSEATITAIIVAMISGLSVAIPTIITTITSNKAHDLVIDEKMKNVTEQVKAIDNKIDKYASNEEKIKERLYKAEESAKSAHIRLDDIMRQLKLTDSRKDR